MSRATKKLKSMFEPAMALELLNDDRAAAVMGAAFVEYALRLAIQARLRAMNENELTQVFDGNGHGALATFSQMIWMGYALSSYGQETREDLLLLKNIRNQFAHEPGDIGFRHPDGAKLCRKLRLPKKLASMMMKAEATEPRRRYEDALHFFAARLHMIGEKHVTRPNAGPDLDLT